MTVKVRQTIEREVATAFIREALRNGYSIGVNDSEETTLVHSKDEVAILKALFTTDDDWLLVYEPTQVNPKEGDHIGWVRLIYGNDGYDVISDYTTNLEHLMADAKNIADRWENGETTAFYSNGRRTN